MTGVRIRDGEFEGRCDYCGEYLPLTFEFWAQGVRRCKACLREYKKLRQRGYAATHAELWRANQRATYAALPPSEKRRRAAARRAWRETHQEHVRAYNLAYRARQRVGGAVK